MENVHWFFLIFVTYQIAVANGFPVKTDQKLNLAVEEVFGIQSKISEKPLMIPKKILNRSIFVVPTAQPECPKGFKLNAKKKCEEIVEVDGDSYFSFILDKLFGYDYDDSDDYEYTDNPNNSKYKNDNKKTKSTKFSIPFL